ncbi:Calcium-transporting ATPase [Fasciola gigantica]|uniref:Calcium-transporting ATPase n=1 Tax=Fasciola gigantica TaxID=46835 RepID=A0A504YB41_FASGI|nr:Calcium-transporting ATPase [Fasciola gigantica]
MDTLASLALATEQPSPEVLERSPYDRTQPLISRQMAENILGHSIYQLGVIFFLLTGAHLFIEVDNMTGVRIHEPTQHYTLIFNTLVLMTLFNEFNAIKIHGQRNVFSGLQRNWLFVVICTAPLTTDQWVWYLFFGVGELIWGQVINTVPNAIIPICKCRKRAGAADAAGQEEEEEEKEEEEEEHEVEQCDVCLRCRLVI